MRQGDERRCQPVLILGPDRRLGLQQNGDGPASDVREPVLGGYVRSVPWSRYSTVRVPCQAGPAEAATGASSRFTELPPNPPGSMPGIKDKRK